MLYCSVHLSRGESFNRCCEKLTHDLFQNSPFAVSIDARVQSISFHYDLWFCGRFVSTALHTPLCAFTSWLNPPPPDTSRKKKNLISILCSHRSLWDHSYTTTTFSLFLSIPRTRASVAFRLLRLAKDKGGRGNQFRIRNLCRKPPLRLVVGKN